MCDMGFQGERRLFHVRPVTCLFTAAGEKVLVPIGEGGYQWLYPLAGEDKPYQEAPEGRGTPFVGEPHGQVSQLLRANDERRAPKRRWVLSNEDRHEVRRALDRQDEAFLHPEEVPRRDLEELAATDISELIDIWYGRSQD